MTGIDTARDETLARLAASRAEIRQILDPPPRISTGEGADGGAPGTGAFPRSRTMKMLLSGRGVGTVGAVVCGLLRMLPAGAIGRMLLVKAISALRSNPASQSKRE
jgi:hypothetical protein